MRKFLVCLVTFLVLMLSACGPDSGEVYALNHYPEHTKTVMVDDYITTIQYDPNLKQNVPRQTWVGQHPEQRTVPACYEVRFKNEDGDKGEECVGKETYESLSIGDWFEK